MSTRIAGAARLALAAVLVAAARPAAAQEPARFRPQPGTRLVEIVSLTSVHGVRNGDTVRFQASEGRHMLQEWSWLPGDPPRLRVRAELPIFGSGIHGDVTYTIDPRGALRAIGDSAVKPTPWNQAFPILPADGRLEPGRTWADSLSDGGTRNGEPFAARSRLAYRVSRVIDTLGTRVAVIDADGREMRRYLVEPGWSLWPVRLADVAGPARRTWWFDLRAGRLIELRNVQDLRGTVTIVRPRASVPADVDTARGGMRSTELWREVSPERAALLRRVASARVMNAFSAVTGYSGTGQHRVRLAGDTTESMFLYGDRMATARTVFRRGRVVTHAWEQVAGTTAGGGMLTAARLSPPAPVAAWAVAAPGMEEHLVPALRALPADSARRHRFAVYRPGDGRWTVGSVQLVPLEWRASEDAFPMTGAVFRDDGGRETALLAFDQRGEVVMARTLEDGRWRRRWFPSRQHIGEYAETLLMGLLAIG